MRSPEAVSAAPAPADSVAALRPQGSAGHIYASPQRAPLWGGEALREPAPTQERGHLPAGALHPGRTGSTPEGRPPFSLTYPTHSLNWPGQSNDLLPRIIPVTLRNLLHPTTPEETSFLQKLFEYYTCKRLLCMSQCCWAQHGEQRRGQALRAPGSCLF